MNIFKNIAKAITNENKKPTYRYVIINSEIGQIHCYESSGNLIEFFTEGRCHRNGKFLIWDDFNIGFLAQKFSLNGYGEFDIRYVSKEEFANSLDQFIKMMGSIEVAKYYFESRIKEKIVEKEKYLEEKRSAFEEEKRRESEYRAHTQEIIKKLNIK